MDTFLHILYGILVQHVGVFLLAFCTALILAIWFAQPLILTVRRHCCVWCCWCTCMRQPNQTACGGLPLIKNCFKQIKLLLTTQYHATEKYFTSNRENLSLNVCGHSSIVCGWFLYKVWRNNCGRHVCSMKLISSVLLSTWPAYSMSLRFFHCYSSSLSNLKSRISFVGHHEYSDHCVAVSYVLSHITLEITCAMPLILGDKS